MKKIKISVLLLSGAILLGSCSTMNNTAKGGVIGGGSGAAAGAIIGGLIGKGKGAAIGAAVGAAVGTGAGVAIGHKMDKKAAEAAKIEGAIVGHTDKVGTYEANMKVSKDRAYTVENYLQDCGVSPSQFKKVEGVGYNQYDDSMSASQNRRVDIYMYASEQMIKNAEAGK